MKGLTAEVRSGLAATIQLARLRGRTRSPQGRLRVRIATVLAGCLLVVAAWSGTYVAWAAARRDASSPIYTLLLGEEGVSLTGALASVLVGMVFAPITGAAAQAQFPDFDLAGVRPARLYRFFDGIWNSILSPVGMSPLLMLVVAASLATADGAGRIGALLLAVSLWVGALLMTALLAWLFEYTRRRWSAAIRWYIAGAATVAAAVIVVADPYHARTVFGLRPWTQGVIRAGATGDLLPLLGAHVLLLAVAAVVLVAGTLVCRRTLVLPAATERVTQRTGSVRVPVDPSWAVFTILVTTLVRTREVRRPIIMMIVVAMPLLFVWIRYSGSNPESMLGSVTMVVPLAMSLGWGVNVFGVLGGAVTLLLAQPRAWKLLLRHVVGVQLAASILLGLALMAVAVLTSSMPWSAMPPYAAGLVASSVIATSNSVRFSVEKPHRTRLTGRGDPLVPPIVGMGYVLRIMATGATTGLFVGIAVSLAPWLGLVAAVLVALAAFRGWRRVSKRWSDPCHRARLAAIVGAV
ncbi:MAG: hypothetical protein ACOH16_11895 [Propionibacteriaceae bacterium]